MQTEPIIVKHTYIRLIVDVGIVRKVNDDPGKLPSGIHERKNE